MTHLLALLLFMAAPAWSPEEKHILFEACQIVNEGQSQELVDKYCHCLTDNIPSVISFEEFLHLEDGMLPEVERKTSRVAAECREKINPKRKRAPGTLDVSYGRDGI